MNCFPIVARDLASELRSRRLRKGRLAAAFVSGLILIIAAMSERWSTGGLSFNKLMRMVPLGSLGPFSVFVIGLNRAVNLLANERREGTLPLLLLTRLSGYDIVFGKLLQALVLELTLFLAITPALVIPFLAAGYNAHELGLTILGWGNVLFFALALGLLISVFADGSKVTIGCLLVVVPMFASVAPFGFLLPGAWGIRLSGVLGWANPCEALAHVPTVAAGFKSGSYWLPLITSHLIAWGCLGMAGWVLPWACRHQAGINAGPSRKGRRMGQPIATLASTHAARSHRLDRNPFLWLTSREGWPTFQIWLFLTLASALWSWLLWLSWVVRGLNLTIVLVIAAAVSWLLSLLATIPREASRRLVEDRLTGALELVLCTALDVRAIVGGQWLSLRRRYVLPVAAVMIVSTGLMAAGYATDGFGGMLDPEDRNLWLFSWLSGILLLPVWLIALCSVAMRRALVARTPAEASVVALLQILGLPGFGLFIMHFLSHWTGWNPDWPWNAVLFLMAFLVAPAFGGWTSRRALLDKLRDAAASRYTTALSG